MNGNYSRTVLAIVTLTMFLAISAAAQTEPQRQQGDKKTQVQANQNTSEIEMSLKSIEPHYLLAMAYKQSAETFARALHDQAQGNAPSTDFARTAVAEISRNLDQALDHQKEHLKTMRADLHANKAAMLKQIDVHRSSLKDAVRALEKEVGEYTLNWKRIAADSAEILMRLDHELLLSETSGD